MKPIRCSPKAPFQSIRGESRAGFHPRTMRAPASGHVADLLHRVGRKARAPRVLNTGCCRPRATFGLDRSHFLCMRHSQSNGTPTDRSIPSPDGLDKCCGAERADHPHVVGQNRTVHDGSRFKAVNTRDKNDTPGAIRLRLAQVEASIERYLDKLDTADRQEADVAEMRTTRLNERIEALRRQMRELQAMATAVETAPDRQISLTDPDARAMATDGKGNLGG